MAEEQVPEYGGTPGRRSLAEAVELEVTWARTVRVWWALAWRSLLAVPLGAAVGCIIGFVVGVLGHTMGADPRQVQIAIQVLTFPIGVLLGLLVGLWAVHVVLGKTFPDFRIVLISREPAGASARRS